MPLRSGTAMPINFCAKVKTWIAISAGVILLLTADILSRAYHELTRIVSLPESFSSSSIPLLFALVTVVPITIIAYRNCIGGCASTTYAKKISPALMGILFGALFFALFVLLLAMKSDQAQQSYLMRMASFSKYLRNAEIYDLLAFLVSINIFRPVLEELVFRGLIFQAIAAKYGPILGAAISSAGFAIIHSGLEFSPVLAFSFGVVSCGLVYYGRGMAGSLFFHATYNSLITTFGFLRGI